MKSKGFKIVVVLLVVVIIVLGGLVVAKSMGTAGEGTAMSAGQTAPEGAIADDSSLPLPPGGVEIADGSGDGEAA